jgi:hypothetical protein
MAKSADKTDGTSRVTRAVDAIRRMIGQAASTVTAAVRTVANKRKSRASDKKTAKQKAAAVVSGTVTATTDAARDAFDKVIDSLDDIATRQNEKARRREEDRDV